MKEFSESEKDSPRHPIGKGAYQLGESMMADCPVGNHVTIGFYGPKKKIDDTTDAGKALIEKCQKAGQDPTKVSECHMPRTFGWPSSQTEPMPLNAPADQKNSTSWVYGQGEDG